MIVPSLRVGMHPVTLRVTSQMRTQSVHGGVPTQSAGTICRDMLAFHPIVIFQP